MTDTTTAAAPTKAPKAKPAKKATGAKAPKKSAKKAPAKKVAGKAAAKANARTAVGRSKYQDEQVITVKKQEHSRREGSRFHKHYEAMRKAGTVGKYRKGGGETDALSAAVAEGYVTVR